MLVVSCHVDGVGVDKISLDRDEAAGVRELAVQGECLSTEWSDAHAFAGKRDPVKFYVLAYSVALTLQGATEMIVCCKCLFEKKKRAGTVKEQKAEYNGYFSCCRACDLQISGCYFSPVECQEKQADHCGCIGGKVFRPEPVKAEHGP